MKRTLTVSEVRKKYIKSIWFPDPLGRKHAAYVRKLGAWIKAELKGKYNLNLITLKVPIDLYDDLMDGIISITVDYVTDVLKKDSTIRRSMLDHARW